MTVRDNLMRANDLTAEDLQPKSSVSTNVVDPADRVLLESIRTVETGGTHNYEQVRAGRGGDPVVGAYGFQRSQWPGLAAGAGLPGADWRSPQAQDQVASFWLNRLYNIYGSLELTAAAWIGGTNSADTLVRRGFQSIADISNSVIRTYVQRVREHAGEDFMHQGGRSGGWVFPVAGANSWSSGDFLYRRTPQQVAAGRSAVHEGIDVFAAKGTPILAPVSGEVVSVGTGNIAGNYVKLKGDDGVIYYFAHNDSNTVSLGQRVQAGTMVGTVGNTGNAQGTQPHIHFTMKNADSGNLINPSTFLAGSGGAYGDYLGVATPHSDVHTYGGTIGERMTSLVGTLSETIAGGPERTDYRTLGVTQIADPVSGEGAQDLTEKEDGIDSPIELGDA